MIHFCYVTSNLCLHDIKQVLFLKNSTQIISADPIKHGEINVIRTPGQKNHGCK